MCDCKALSTPMAEHVKLTKDMFPLEGSEKQRVMSERSYRGLIGSLNYLSLLSRLDIAQATSSVLFLENPGEQHWVAAKHVWRYLQGTKDLTFQK